MCGTKAQQNTLQQQKRQASQAVTYEPNWVNKNKDPQRTTVNEASKKCQKNALIKRDTGE